MAFPQRRGELETFQPQIRDICSDPLLQDGYERWCANRERFLAYLQEPDSAANKARWQKEYFRSVAPGGFEAPDHQTKLRLLEFADVDETSSAI